jgi:hypothetical protein
MKAPHTFIAHTGLTNEPIYIASLGKVSKELKAVLKAEEALRNFKAQHNTDYMRIASQTISAVYSVNALDTANCYQKIIELKGEIAEYQTEMATLKEVEGGLATREQDCKSAAAALSTNKREQRYIRIFHRT